MRRAMDDRLAHVRHLARLARLDLAEAEAVALAEEIDRILASFGELPAGSGASRDAAREADGRPDGAAPASLETVEAILAQFPRRSGRLLLAPRGGE